MASYADGGRRPVERVTDPPDGRREPAMIGRSARSVLGHVRDPLFLNAYALGLSGIVTSGLGVVYWAVAARLYPTDIVGINAALLSLVTLGANISQLNLRSAFGRFVPIAGTKLGPLVWGGYLAAFALAATTGVLMTAALVLVPGVIARVEGSPVLLWLLPITVVLWTIFSVQDHALVAFRRATLVPFENGVFALAKIALLVPLAGLATAYGILLSWAIPTAIGVVIVSAYILGRLVPAAARDPAMLRDDPRGLDVTPRSVLGFVGADYAGSLFAIAAASIQPVIVLAALGPTESAYFYVVSLIAMAAQLVPTVLATSLLVEVSSAKASFEVDGRRVVRQLALLLGPIVVVLVVFAEPILSIFGPDYAAAGASTLRLLALAGIPFAIINLAFIRLRLEARVRSIVAVQAILAAGVIVPILFLVPQFGIVAIGAATLFVQSIVAAVLGRAELGSLMRGIVSPAPRGLPSHRATANDRG